MQRYRFLFRLGPPAYFGLPDGEKLVVPVEAGGTISSPVLDTRTGHKVSHGSLSRYRTPESALAANLQIGDHSIKLSDNFLEVWTQSPDPQDATSKTIAYVDLFVQSLSSMYGERFFASLMAIEDEHGNPQSVAAIPRTVPFFTATIYNTQELSERIGVAATWAQTADAVAQKALFYFEHACLLEEFSSSLTLSSPHASFSRALAFLQLFKALTSIIGDPSTDRDYQSRCKRLGLQKDFWEVKAKPLYEIRNEQDVAHYSHSLPQPGMFLGHYRQAVAVFREALGAHMAKLAQGERGG